MAAASSTKNNEYDDDLDSYLDDVLDDFAPPIPSKPAVANTAPLSDASLEDEFDNEFARQLAANMEDLLRGSLDGGNSEGDNDAGPLPSQADLKATMEQLVGALKDIQVNKGVGVGTDPALQKLAAGGGSKPTVDASGGEPSSFQDRVSETMNRLRDSSDKAQARTLTKLAAEDTRPDPAIPGFDDETMEQMMKELEAMMSSGDFENQFGGMMDQLMSKELLHEPMKDLAAKYPEWMVANASKVPAEEMEKYRRQHDIIKEIVAIYDACPETETTAEDSQRVAELMRKMQECGNPPEEILQELAPGMAMGTDDMPQNCSVM